MTVITTIAPSCFIKKKKDFSKGIENLQHLGFRFINKRAVTKPLPTLKKVAQLHNAFLNERVKIILAQRGGCGCLKLLPRLDYKLIRSHPKILAGFSDLSALLNVISERTGLITLHSPMVINFCVLPSLTRRSFLNAIRGFPNRNLLDGAPVAILRSGIAKGCLKGGNLITLTALIGTKWEIDTRGSILFLEEVNQKLYEVDRFLTQWILAGKLRGLKGLILGDFKGIKNRDVYKILSSQMEIDFPVVHCPYIGHSRQKITLPIGARVELNTKRKALTLL